jgi:hypothetical protein
MGGWGVDHLAGDPARIDSLHRPNEKERISEEALK